MTPGIDGLDFDMESTYTTSQLKIAHGVIEAPLTLYWTEVETQIHC